MKTKCHGYLLLFCLVLGGVATSASAAPEITWREVDPENLVIMEMQEGRVMIELNPLFAPETVEQFRRLVDARFYDGLGFYRVIDGFVAQGGDGSDLGERSEIPLIDAEFEINWNADLSFTRVQENDLFAAETGLIDGFAVARDLTEQKIWLTHCPGIVAMARNDSPDSSRTDFYIVIGQAPRYLDRNMNIFGRVVYGMDIVQRIRRGKASDNGIIEDETASSRIRTMKMGSAVAKEDRMDVFVMDTNSKGFASMLKDRRKRGQKFFYKKPPRVLDVCQVPVAGRITR